MNKLEVDVLDKEIKNIISQNPVDITSYANDYIDAHPEIKKDLKEKSLTPEDLNTLILSSLMQETHEKAIKNLYEKGTNATIQELTIPIQNYIDYTISNILNLYGQNNTKISNQFITDVSELDSIPATAEFEFTYSFVENQAVVGIAKIVNFEELEAVEDLINIYLEKIIEQETLKDLKNTKTSDNDAHELIKISINNFLKANSGETHNFAMKSSEFIKKFDYCSEIISNGQTQNAQQAKTQFEENLLEINDNKVVQKIKFKA